MSRYCHKNYLARAVSVVSATIFWTWLIGTLLSTRLGLVFLFTVVFGLLISMIGCAAANLVGIPINETSDGFFIVCYAIGFIVALSATWPRRQNEQ